MRSVLKAFLLLVVVIVVLGGVAVWYLIDRGVSAREQPGRLEIFLARQVRSLAIDRRAKSLKNPVEPSTEVLTEGRAHFADHCAACHGNDGSGNTDMGRGMYPRPPDMRLAATQDLTDGELFWIIENGVRFTGMPAWGSGTNINESSSWPLVHFIRRLPKLTPEELKEMESLNPRSPVEMSEQSTGEQKPDPATPSKTPHSHTHSKPHKH